MEFQEDDDFNYDAEQALFDDEKLKELIRLSPEKLNHFTICDLGLRALIRSFSIAPQSDDPLDDPVYLISKLFEEYHFISAISSNYVQAKKRSLKRSLDLARKNKKSNQLHIKVRITKLNRLFNKPLHRKGAGSVGPEEILLFCVVRILFQREKSKEVDVKEIDWEIVRKILYYAHHEIFNKKPPLTHMEGIDQIDSITSKKPGRKRKKQNLSASAFSRYFNLSRLNNIQSDKYSPLYISYRFSRRRLSHLSFEDRTQWDLPFRDLLKS